jgi:hypothetical protein
MSIISGANVIKDSLVLGLDATNYNSSVPNNIVNIINPSTVGISRYNNPGFSGTVRLTGETFRGAPVYELTFSPQDSSFIPRLGSGEGFGALHSMGTILLAGVPYMSSIYFRTDYPLTGGFNNTYSNISGWGNSGTTLTRYQEGQWTRLYTRYLNGTTINGTTYSVRGTSSNLSFNVNTSAQTDILITCTFNSNGTFSCVGPLNSPSYTLVQANEMVGIYDVAPTIVSSTVTGLSTGSSAIIQHGLNTSTWTKLSTANNILRSNFPLNYFFLIRVPTTSGINQSIVFRPNISSFNTGLGDSKYWKITFNTSNLQVNDVIRTYWAAPMLEQTDRIFPPPYTIGTRVARFSGSIGWADLSGNSNHASLFNLPTYNFDNFGSYSFDGIDDIATVTLTKTASSSYEFFASLGNITGGRMLFNAGPNGVGPNLYFNSNQIMWNTWDGNSNFFGNMPANATDGRIHHYVVVCESGVNCRLFYDGNLLGTATYRNPAATNTLAIGGSALGGSFLWLGRIAKVRVYNKVLSANEVKQNFEASRRKYGI